jgi:deazaflavin-dependent oxidoreductase (nitroreductase family)
MTLWVMSVFAILMAGLLTAVLLVRFCKPQLAVIHRAFTNRLLGPFAARLPGFGIVINVGRKSGIVYRTPVNVFRRPDGFLIALTYGKDSGWAKNVLAAGKCQIETRKAFYQLTAPVIVFDPSRRQFPFLVRQVLWLVNANHYLRLFCAGDLSCKPVDSDAAGSSSQPSTATRSFSRDL